MPSISAPLAIGLVGGGRRIRTLGPPLVAWLLRLVKSREVGADAGGVDAKIAAPMARRGAHVDATSRAGLGDPDDDVVGEAHPKALLARLDAACRGIGLDDRPTHLLRCRERKRERLVGRERQRLAFE